MIDLIKAKNVFKNYTSQFKPKDNKIESKIKHTYGVVNVSKYIAEKLGLSQEDVELAQLIALLHDIGRFEQAMTYDTYDDYSSVDHAELGIKILFKDGLIRKFIEIDEYDDIIKIAIKNHNKFEIEQGLSKSELLHSKIIRDADKADNYNIKQKQDFHSLFNSTIEKVEKEKISPEIWSEFLQEKTIVTSHRKTNMDKWLSYIAWVFDFNFYETLKFIQENDCINTIIDRLNYKDSDTKNKMEIAKKIANQYIKDRIKKGC